jgi:hypothetical protein
MRSLTGCPLITRLRCCRKGTAMLELALVLPVLVTLLISGAEFTRLVIANQKLERVSASVADMVSQSQSLPLSQLQSIFGMVDRMMAPFPVVTDGTVIVTSVSGVNGKPVVQWQETYGHGSDPSKLGGRGQEAHLPAGLTLRDEENVIVCEIYLTYEPMVMDRVLDDQKLYRVAAFRPRYGPLDTDPRSL